MVGRSMAARALTPPAPRRETLMRSGRFISSIVHHSGGLEPATWGGGEQVHGEIISLTGRGLDIDHILGSLLQASDLNLFAG